MYILTRYRFNWDEVKFSIFQTYNFITHTVGKLKVFSIHFFYENLADNHVLASVIQYHYIILLYRVNVISSQFYECYYLT